LEKSENKTCRKNIMAKELPIKIQTILYRIEDNIPLILVVKRSPQDGNFWQTITGTLEIDESIFVSRNRELEEEIGITDAIFDEDEVNRFSWKKEDWTVVEIVYSAVTNTKEIRLSPEHTEYRWLTIDDAIDLVEKVQTKECLIKFKEIKLL